MINLYANEELKQLGCKWNGAEWIPPKLAKKEADEIKNKYYSDLIVIECTFNEHSTMKGKDWHHRFGYRHVRMIAGYIVASAKGRDSGADISDDIAVLVGSFNSGGSMKNYSCTYTDDMKIRMEISKNLLPVLIEESKENNYIFEIINEDK